MNCTDAASSSPRLITRRNVETCKFPDPQLKVKSIRAARSSTSSGQEISKSTAVTASCISSCRSQTPSSLVMPDHWLKSAQGSRDKRWPLPIVGKPTGSCNKVPDICPEPSFILHAGLPICRQNTIKRIVGWIGEICCRAARR